jgi:hypothetical protein
MALSIAIFAIGLGCAKAPDDAELGKQLSSRFSQDSGLQGKSITVQAKAGVVTLSGTVDNDAQRTAAASYAATTPGIKVVVNNLQVAPAIPPATSDATPSSASASSAPEAKPQPSVGRRQKRAAAPDHEASNADSPGRNNTSDSEFAADQSAATQLAVNQVPPHTAPSADQPPDAPPADAPPPPLSAPTMMTIQAGSPVSIRLIDGISSESAQAGQTFRATLDSPLSSDWDVAIPAGYTVEGHVVEAKSAGKFAGQAELVLQLDKILVGDKSYDIQTNQYRREGKKRSTDTAEKVGAGAVIGAIIGGIAGGGKGAGIGAAAGGGVGGGVQAASKPEPIKLPSETVLNFTLQSPLTVPQVQQSPESERRKLQSKD